MKVKQFGHVRKGQALDRLDIVADCFITALLKLSETSRGNATCEISFKTGEYSLSAIFARNIHSCIYST